MATDLAQREIFFLVNKRCGETFSGLAIVDDQWRAHPNDPNADLAVIQVANSPDADIVPIAIETIGVPEELKKLTVGIGDETHAVGLFSAVPGTQSNMPIVRSGNIAHDAFRTNSDGKLGFTDVYLIEARSIGGMSGSPVFVQPTVNLGKNNTREGIATPVFAKAHGRRYLA